MATALPDLIGFLDDLLKPASFEDHAPNGLQVPGRRTVKTVVTGVSASLELLERAAGEAADLVLVHHGLLWNGPVRPMDPATKRRLATLFEHNMTLAAYHLPLDAHPEHGNNALLAAALGATVTGPFAEIGVLADLAGCPAAELAARVRSVTGREPLVVGRGPEAVNSVAVVSGAGQSLLPRAIAAGCDAFVTGEASERNFDEAREGAIHFVAAGHYATETLGIRRLGELLAERFGVRHVHVDLPNPI